MKRNLFSQKSVIVALCTSLTAIGLLGALLITQPTQVTAKITSSSRAKQTNTMNEKLVRGNTQFGFKLFSQILKQSSNQNIFVSPTSVAIALSMTYNGASGTTQQAIAQTLELQGMSLNEINQSQLNLSQALTKIDPQVQLDIANSLWAREGVTFKPEFLQKTKQFYQAKVSNLNFSQPNAVSTINNWVSQSTKGKIPTIIDQISPADILFLINAIYFKGSWQKEFSKNATQQRPFTLINGTRKQHPLMSQSGKYRYSENQQFQAVSLPYGSGRLSMYVFLPKSNVSLTSFYNNLTAQNWQQWLNKFASREGSISLPRFKLEYNITLNKALEALGMEVAFSNKANFSNMTSVPAQIDEVKHKTFVEVNEQGTEAAAVTSLGIRATSIQMPDEPPFKMVVDRPFFCAIVDNQTGSVLFMGSIVDPK